MNFRPLHNAVVVEPLAESEVIGSLVIPATSLHGGGFDESGGTVGAYMDRGRVAAVGEGYRYGRKFHPDSSGSKKGTWESLVHAELLPLDLKVGDIVLYAHKGGEDYIEDGIRYRIIPESQIDAVLEADA